MARPEIDVITTHPDLLGECPVWDVRTEQLHHVDIDGRSIHRTDPSTGATSARSLEGRPGSIAMTDDPDVLLVASEHQLLWLTWSTGTAVPWIDLEPGGGPNRLNDGRCDPTGRFWVGSMHEDENGTTGFLHRIDDDGTTSLHRDRIGVPNGTAFSPDGTRMYFADSPAHTVWQFDYDAVSGTPSHERVFNDFSHLPGFPDGACIDEDGCYWIACVFGSAVARLTPDGDLDRIVELPVRKPTMPAFGGPDLGTLFVTSIGGGGSHPRPTEPGVDGKLLAVDVGVRGIAEPVFARIERRD